MAGMSLYAITSEHRALCEMLEASGGEITPEIEEALALNAETFVTKADGYCEVIAKYNGLAKMAGERIKQLQVVKRIAENAERRMKERLMLAMTEYELPKVESGVHTMVLRTTKAVEILDEARIPNKYIKVETSVDKAQLRADMLEGAEVEGAKIVENKSLMIR